jgi:hypothetical protein
MLTSVQSIEHCDKYKMLSSTGLHMLTSVQSSKHCDKYRMLSSTGLHMLTSVQSSEHCDKYKMLSSTGLHLLTSVQSSEDFDNKIPTAVEFFIMNSHHYIELLLYQLQMKTLFLSTLLDQEIIYVPIVVLYDGHLKVLEELYVAQMGRMEICVLYLDLHFHHCCMICSHGTSQTMSFLQQD